MTEVDPLFSDKNEVKVKYNNIKFGKEGDWFKGTLTDNTRQMRNELSERGEMQTIFEFKAAGGSFHDIIDREVAAEPTTIKAGEFWSYITGKPAILNQLKSAQIGQVVGFRFAEQRPSKKKGFNPTKIIKVFIGDMDPEYQGETAADSAA